MGLFAPGGELTSFYLYGEPATFDGEPATFGGQSIIAGIKVTFGRACPMGLFARVRVAFFSSYTQVYSVIYDSGSVPE